jgi:hypothetical protein
VNNVGMRDIHLTLEKWNQHWTSLHLNYTRAQSQINQAKYYNKRLPECQSEQQQYLNQQHYGAARLEGYQVFV